MIRWLTFVALGLSITMGAVATATNGLSEAEIQGRQLAQRILEQRPAESFTNTGVLQIHHANGETSKVPIKCKVIVTATNWQSIYEASDKLTVIHALGQMNKYFYVPSSLWDGPLPPSLFKSESRTNGLSHAELSFPFAGSDFWIADLGLEFFHWPDQKILKEYEMRRGRACHVLESINPKPSPNGYSRVDSWIDNETLGIVQAEAYDAKGKLFKRFYPKDFKKVNGLWEMGEMEMINDQTGSRTWIKFDLKKHD
jgi:Outer membrane lipoprotein-sorting protein